MYPEIMDIAMMIHAMTFIFFTWDVILQYVRKNRNAVAIFMSTAPDTISLIVWILKACPIITATDTTPMIIGGYSFWIFLIVFIGVFFEEYYFDNS